MPSLDSLLPALLVALLLLVFLAFTFGTQRNIARGNAVLRWLQEALPGLGKRTTLRWLGSSVVELDLAAPNDPFREVAILVVLEPRDVPLLWAFARSRGRRDMLIFRTSLQRAPRIEMDVSEPDAWMASREPLEEPGWQTLSWADGARAHARGRADPAAVEVVRVAWTRLTRASAGVSRISVRQTVPHLEVHVRPPDLRAVGSAPLVEAIRGLAADVSG